MQIRHASITPTTGPARATQRDPRARPQPLLLSALALAIAVLVSGVPAPAHAQAPAAAAASRYDIPAGPLGDALNQFARQAGLALSFTPVQVQDKTSPGVQGSLSPQDGLARLLAGTGLVAQFTPAGYVLEDAPPAVDASASPSARTLDTVEVRASSIDDQLKDDAWRAAGSSLYMSRDDVERSRGTSVGDIFKGTTGVLVGENRNSGGLDVNIRGMQGQGRVPILIDGARQETTVYRGYSGVASRSYIDPDLIGGISIDKGPTMSAQGTGATGGLVQARTLNADDIIKPGKTFGFRVRGTAIGNNTGSPLAAGTETGLWPGKFNGGTPTYRTDCATASLCSGSYALPTEWGSAETMNRSATATPKSWAGSIAAAKRWEKIDLVAAYAQRQQGNYYAGKHGPSAWMDTSKTQRTPFYTNVYPTIQGASVFRAQEAVPGTNYESRTTLLKGKTFLPNDQELELSYMRYSSTYGEIMPSQITRLLTFTPVVQPNNSEVKVDTYASRYRWNPESSPLVDLRANLWHTKTVSTNNSPSETQDTGWNNERGTYDRTGLDLENTSSFQHGRWGESQLRYGLAFQTEKSNSVPLTETTAELQTHNGTRDENSAFASWQYKPTSTVIVDAGLRYTRFKSHDSRDIVLTDTSNPLCTDSKGDGTCDAIANRNKKSGTAPIASISWEPGNRGLQFYARHAQAYRMPSLFESTQGFSTVAQPDVILKPEHTYNREIGVNYLKDGLFTGSDKLRLKFAYFRNHTKDYLTRTTCNLWESACSEGSDSYTLVMRNIDSATFNGLEFSGTYDLGWIYTDFGVTKYNNIEVCYSNASYRVQACNNYGVAGSYINNMVPPKWHANLTLGTRLLERKLNLGVRTTFMGKRNSTPEYNNDTSRSFLSVVPWHAYKVFDLYASYRFNDNVSVDFNVDNLTDRYYLDALGLGLIPAPGRTARLSVTLQY